GLRAPRGPPARAGHVDRRCSPRAARGDLARRSSPVPGRRTAVPTLARRHDLGRPEAGDRMTWQLRRATADDLEPLMAMEHEIFGGDAWSNESMAAELGDRNGYYLV